jgi:hypothetical protein
LLVENHGTSEYQSFSRFVFLYISLDFLNLIMVVINFFK